MDESKQHTFGAYGLKCGLCGVIQETPADGTGIAGAQIRFPDGSIYGNVPVCEPCYEDLYQCQNCIEDTTETALSKEIYVEGDDTDEFWCVWCICREVRDLDTWLEQHDWDISDDFKKRVRAELAGRRHRAMGLNEEAVQSAVALEFGMQLFPVRG